MFLGGFQERFVDLNGDHGHCSLDGPAGATELGIVCVFVEFQLVV